MAVLDRCLCVVLLMGVFTGCSKEYGTETGLVGRKQEPEQVISYRNVEGGSKTSPVWYEITPEGLNPVADPANSQVVPYEPWTSARRPIGFVATGSFAFAGLNRDGFLLFEEVPEGDLALYRVSGGELVAPFCTLAIIQVPRSELALEPGLEQSGRNIMGVSSQGLMPALLVARDPYFVDSSSTASSFTVPAKPLVVFNWSDFSLLSTRPRAFGSGTTDNIDALSRGADGRWYFKAAAGEKGKLYFTAPALNRDAVAIDRTAYQQALNPQPFAKIPKTVQALIRSFTDSQRNAHFPVLQLVQKDKAIVESFVADPEVKNPVPLSGGETDIIKYLGFSDKNRAVVVLGDGRGLIHNSKVEAIALPPLAESFVYTGIVMLPHWIIASWEEQESFAVGAAGFLVLPL